MKASGAKALTRHDEVSERDSPAVFAWTMLVLVWVPALLFVPALAEGFRLPKLVVSEWLALGAVLLLLPRLVPIARIDLWRVIASQPCIRALVPLLGVAAISFAASAHREYARDALCSLLVAVITTVGLSVGVRAAYLRRVLAYVVGPGVLLAAVAIFQFHGLQPLEIIGQATGRLGVISLAGNSGDLGAYLVLPCLLLQEAVARRRKHRGWRLAALMVCGYGVAVTQNITAIGALIAGSGVLWVRVVRGRLVRYILVPLTALVLVVTVVAGPLQQRLGAMFEQTAKGDLNEFLSGRLDGWRAAAAMIADAPLLGIGYGAYGAAFAPAKLALARSGTPFLGRSYFGMFASAHNEPLQWVAECGALGAAALAWALFVFIRAVAATGRLDALAPAGAVSLSILCLAYFPLHLALTAYPWLIWIAWCCRQAYEQHENRRELVSKVRGRSVAVVCGLAVSALLMLQLHRGTVRMRTSAVVRWAQGVGRAVVTGAAPPAALGPVIAALRAAERRHPHALELLETQGDVFFLVGRYADAEEAYRKALKVQMRPELLFHLAVIAWRQGARERAVELAGDASLLDSWLNQQLPQDLRRALDYGGAPKDSSTP